MLFRLSLLALALVANAAPAAEFDFKDSDRVVLIGSTMIEREQRYGYWEAAITAGNPDKNITFRNLGWSGDTVWGEARAGFDSPADGYKRLVEHVKAEKPTVIMVGYGTNESFAGEQGLPRFNAQLKKLLDDLAVTKARFILLAPMKLPKLPPPMPNPAKANKNIALYSNAIKAEARRRDCMYLDDHQQVLDMVPTPSSTTDYGGHPTAFDYALTSSLIALRLGGQETLSQININVEKKTCTAVMDAEVARDGDSLRFRIKPRAITIPVLDDPKYRGPGLFITGGPKEQFRATIDGAPVQIYEFPVGRVTQQRIVSGPELDQGKKLLQTIIAKNELYFHRWRPQNVTYLFGFRKHEQGNNAREIPQFDPLVEAKEKEIAKLRVPMEHTYELVPVKEKK